MAGPEGELRDDIHSIERCFSEPLSACPGGPKVRLSIEFMGNESGCHPDGDYRITVIQGDALRHEQQTEKLDAFSAGLRRGFCISPSLPDLELETGRVSDGGLDDWLYYDGEKNDAVDKAVRGTGLLPMIVAIRVAQPGDKDWSEAESSEASSEAKSSSD